MATNPAMAAALDRLWTKFLPEIEQRVALLEAAIEALSSGSLTPEQRQAAYAAAHKLAGSLGTFGLQRGTELARQCEDILGRDFAGADLGDLKKWVVELRTLVQSRRG
jgi:HPt (histidine-containing phosphotransfer) domain-containing protein